MRWSQRSAIGILLGGVSLLAQKNTPPVEPKPSAASQIEEAAKKHASQRGSSEPMGILTDTMGVDFNPYLSRVLHDVRQNWCSHIPDVAHPLKTGKVVLELAILKNGSVAGLKVVESSGDLDLDRPAYVSITESNPFPPLPSEFKGQYIGLRFSYYYNLDPNDVDQHLVVASCKEAFPSANNNLEAKPEASPSKIDHPSQAVASGPDALEAKVRKAWEDFKNKNKESFAAILADGFSEVEEDGNGFRNKQAEVAEIDQFNLRRYSLKDFNIKPIGADGALVTYMGEYSGTFAGQPVDGKSAWAEVWVRRGDDWKLLHVQETKVR